MQKLKEKNFYLKLSFIIHKIFKLPHFSLYMFN